MLFVMIRTANKRLVRIKSQEAKLLLGWPPSPQPRGPIILHNGGMTIVLLHIGLMTATAHLF